MEVNAVSRYRKKQKDGLIITLNILTLIIGDVRTNITKRAHSLNR